MVLELGLLVHHQLEELLLLSGSQGDKSTLGLQLIKVLHGDVHVPLLLFFKVGEKHLLSFLNADAFRPNYFLQL